MSQSNNTKIDQIASLIESLDALVNKRKNEKITKNDILSHLVDLLKNTIKSELDIPESQKEKAFSLLRYCLTDKDKSIRTQALRAIRYLLNDLNSLSLLFGLNIDIFVVLSLEREQDFLWERVQALKLIRRIIEISPHKISKPITRSLIAISQQEDEDFRRVALETLRDLILNNVELMNSGVITLIEAILDPSCSDIAHSLTLTLLSLLDSEKTRKYITELDIARLFSIFTDLTQPDGAEREAHKLSAHHAILTMLRSYSGILYLTSSKYGLRSLVDYIELPPLIKGGSWAREAIFDLFLNLLDFLNSNHSDFRRVEPNLLNSYSLILLLSFIECGLIDRLISLASSSDADFCNIGRRLLSEILNISSNILPISQIFDLHAMPSVINEAVSFQKEHSFDRLRSAAIITKLNDNDIQSSYDGLTTSRGLDFKSRSTFDKLPSVSSNRLPLFGFNIDRILISYPHRYHLRYSKNMKTHSNDIQSLKMLIVNDNYNEDDVQKLFKQANIMNDKDWQTWDWGAIGYLLDGPLLYNSSFFTLALKNKFFKRLLSFLNPSRHLFVDLEWSFDNFKILKVICSLLSVLLSYDEGSIDFEFFKEFVNHITLAIYSHTPAVRLENKTRETSTEKNLSITGSILRHISFSGDVPGLSADDCLSLHSVQTRMSREIITFIGFLSHSKRGMKMLLNESFFNRISDLCLDPSQDYIARSLIAVMNFGDGYTESLSLLSYWSKKGSSSLRRYIINHLRLLFRANSSRFPKCGLEILIDALGANEEEIALASLSVLEELFIDPNMIKAFCSLNPENRIKNVVHDANRIMLRCAGYTIGLSFLQNAKLLGPYITLWLTGENKKYVTLLESSIATALSEGFNHFSNPKYIIRSSLLSNNDYKYYEGLHSLPWTIDVTLNYPSGKQIQLLCDTFIDTQTTRVWKRMEFFRKPLVNSEMKEAGETTTSTASSHSLRFIIRDDYEDGVFLQVTGVIVEKTRAKAYAIDEDVSITATLSIGSMKSDNKRLASAICSPNSRNNVASALDHFILEDENTSWHFFSRESGYNKVVYLQSINFRIPFTSFLSPHVPVEPHLFGQIAKTNTGCEFLKQTDCIPSFISSIRNDDVNFLEKRAAFWVIGHIGSHRNGLELLKEYDRNIISYIASSVFNSPVLSIRATCFYIVGLLSMQAETRDFLKQNGWDFPQNIQLGIAVPTNVSAFFNVPSIEYKQTVNENVESESLIKRLIQLAPPADYDSIIVNLCNLCNHMTQMEAYKALTVQKQQFESVFRSPILFYIFFHLISTCKFRLAARRFILYDLLDNATFTPESMSIFDKLKKKD